MYPGAWRGSRLYRSEAAREVALEMALDRGMKAMAVRGDRVVAMMMSCKENYELA